MKKTGPLALLAVLLCGSVAAQERTSATGWLDNLTVTASGTGRWVDNLSRTSFAPTRQSGETYELDLGATRHQQLAPDWLLQGGVDAALLEEPDFNLNNQLNLGPRLGVQRKFGLGPLAPVLQLDTGLTYRAARFSADSGWTTDASLRLSKRLTSSLKVGASAQWLEHYARNQLFDLEQRGYSVDATWDLNERWSLNGSAGRTSGDIVANAAWSVWSQAITGGFGPAVETYYNARPWGVTNLYGSGWVSYNVEATIDLWSLAAAYAVSGQTTVELRYGSAFVVNKIGIRYPQESWGLSLIHRF